jgi:heterodisulfide reductase subunit A
MKPRAKIGVYVCHCGANIATTVDVEKVAAFASGLPGVAVARHYTYMCSDPGQALIKQDIAELRLNRVVVASCSPTMHELTFRRTVQEAGLNSYCFEMANIREQCSWVHHDIGEATEKAKHLVASAVSKAALLEPLMEREVAVTPAALVIGGGIAGLQAALDIAEAGFQVYLVEKEPHLGGHMAELNKTFPALESAGTMLAEKIQEIEEHPNIQVLTSSRVVDVGGYIGNFTAMVRSVGDSSPRPPGDSLPLSVGVIIVATGFAPFDARLKPELGYGAYPNVITTLEFERLSSASGPTKGKITLNGQEPKDVVFIHCVGSRDESVGNPYCSRVCCMATAKQAYLVREKLPEACITVFYMDVRAFGKGFEEFYDQVREEGVVYRRGNPSEIYKRGDKLVVRAEDTLLGEPVEVEADLVVLAVGMVPRVDAEEVAGLLRLPRSGDGFFMEAHPKLRPVDTVVDGVYLAGCCQGPKDIPDAVAQAKAAASSALIPLARGKVTVEAATATVEEEICSGCGVCQQVCVYEALSLNERKGVMTVNKVLCKGCGACAVACPSGAIKVSHFTPDQILAQAEALAIV